MEKARGRGRQNLPGLPAAQAARKAGPVIRMAVASGASMRASINDPSRKIKGTRPEPYIEDAVFCPARGFLAACQGAHLAHGYATDTG